MQRNGKRPRAWAGICSSPSGLQGGASNHELRDDAGISEVGGREKQLAERSESFDIRQVARGQIGEGEMTVAVHVFMRPVPSPDIGWSDPKITPKQA